MKTASKKTETREEQQARELAEVGKNAYESIAEMVAKLDACVKDDDGEETDEPDDEARDEARQAIQEDPLSVQVRTGWYSPGDEAGAPEEFEILLGTGGPAVRIVGELGNHGEPSSACLQTQNWFTPWTDYVQADESVLLAYCREFYFGEG